MKDLTIEKNGQIYHYQHSYYYNWYKALELNLLNSEAFTQFFIGLKTHDLESYQTIQEKLFSLSQKSFSAQLSDQDTFILMTYAWASGFNTATLTSQQRLQHFLTNYTIQKNDLIGLNQMNADLNQGLLQHLPKVRKQDLSLLYRLLTLQGASSQEKNASLEKLNQRAQERTKKLLVLLAHAE